ncbi:MAG: alpha-1,2-mannosidase [Flavobacteriaceae bacterium]|nr:alpha-1,2-mannosidase [Flavobacteriaceae bacterium]
MKNILIFLLLNILLLENIASQDLTSYVDTRIGTKDSGLESGYTFLGATYPFGMIQFTPSFFSPHKGFVVTQLSGAGCPNMGNFPVIPFSGEIDKSPNDMSGANIIDSIIVSKAGMLQAIVNKNVNVSLTASERTGFAKFLFNNSNIGSIAIGSGVNSTSVSEAYINITSNRSCEGFASGSNFCGTDIDYKIFFAVEFDRPYVSNKVWKDSEIFESNEVTGKNSGAIFSFDTSKEKIVNYKISISYVSTENAKLNLNSENLSFSFDSYRENNTKSWNKHLNKIKVDSNDNDRLIQFYTSFYRSLIHPNIVSDKNGEYMGADFKVHKVNKGRKQYSSFSVWDTYRTQAQLLAFLFPRQSSDMVQSLIDFADQAGGYGRWILANIETGVMQGDPTPILISNSYAFGAKNFNVNMAYFHMKRGATIPRLNSQKQEIRPYLTEFIRDGHTFASMLLEYISSDYAIGQFAKNALQLNEDYSFFINRSKSWENIYNPKIKWLNSRYPNGKWKDIKSDWREGTYKNYFWMVPHDLESLINKIGGKAFAEKRLDNLFERLDARYEDDWFASGNEPDFHVPWIYNWTDSPEKTSLTIKRILDSMYNTSDSGLPGNDDLGTMGAWYVLASIGLYPVIPGIGGFSLNLPQFDNIKISIGKNILEIIKSNNNIDFIKSMTLNGEKQKSTWIDLSQIALGGKIIYNDDISDLKWLIKTPPPSF